MRTPTPSKTTYKSLIAFTAALMIAGCASSGGVEVSDEALSGNPVAMWDDGQKTVKKGEALVKKGESRLEDGREQIRDGEAMISKGNDKVRDSRQDYQAKARSGGASSTPKEVAAEAKRLKAIGAIWEDGIEEIRDGNKLVEKGNKALEKGQSEIRQGRSLIESGSTLMRNSQRIRLGEDLLPAAIEDTLSEGAQR